MSREPDIWSIIIILGAVLILAWAVLKAIGFFQSPMWVEMMPFFGIGTVILGGTYKLGKIKKGIEQTEKKVDNLIKIEERFSRVEHEHKLAMDGKLKCPAIKRRRK